MISSILKHQRRGGAIDCRERAPEVGDFTQRAVSRRSACAGHSFVGHFPAPREVTAVRARADFGASDLAAIFSVRIKRAFLRIVSQSPLRSTTANMLSVGRQAWATNIARGAGNLANRPGSLRPRRPVGTGQPKNAAVQAEGSRFESVGLEVGRMLGRKRS